MSYSYLYSSSEEEEEPVVRTSDGVKFVTEEEANEMLSRFRKLTGMDKPSPSQWKTKGWTPKPTYSSRSNNGKQLPLGKRPNAAKHKKDPKSTKLPEVDKEKILSHNFATAALSYLRKKGHNLELVEACLYESMAITFGSRVHFNFKAKCAFDPSAPVETYFGQLRHYSDSNIVECCVSLGEFDSLPNERDNQGCHFCTKYVHHPVGGCKGIIWGLLRWSKKKEMFYFI